MCKYCNDENEKKIIEKPIDLGVLGEYCLDISVSESELWFEFLPADVCEAIYTETIKITYCPFCGRRIKAKERTIDDDIKDFARRRGK